MHRIDQPTAVSSLPTPAAAGTPGYFTGGNPATGSPATVLDADWANNIQEELISILTAAGITPSKTANNQVLISLQNMFSAPVVGTARNLKCSVSAASSTATFSADEVVVEYSLGGLGTKLASYSQAVNLATTGAGGMDNGTAPASGYVAIYAIYGTSGTSILATNATSAAAPNVYGAGHMPSGYTSSALISVWPTDSSGHFVAGYQVDRSVYFNPVTVINTSTQQSSFVSLSIAGAVPLNARSWGGFYSMTSSSASAALNFGVAGYGASTIGIGEQFNTVTSSTSTGSGISGLIYGVPIITSQVTYYYTVASPGTINFSINCSSYTI